MKGRKAAAAFISVLLMAGFGTRVYAETPDGTITAMPDSKTITVTGSYVGTGELLDTYSVDIEWGAMNFTYNAEGNRTWDKQTHTYSVSSTDGWTAEGNIVKVTNHSNVPVNVDFNFEKSNVNGTYTGIMSVAKKTLNAGVENKPLEADFVESKLTLDGTLNALQTEKTELGTIKVSLTAVENNEP